METAFSCVSDYFKKKGVSTLTVKELFDFVTDVTITAENLDDYLDECMRITSNRTVEDITEQDKIDEAVCVLISRFSFFLQIKTEFQIIMVL